MTYPPEMTRNIVNGTMKRFITARGKQYYLYLGVLDKHLGEDMVARAAEMRAQYSDGMLSYADLLHLMVEFEFPSNRFKSMLDLLHKRGAINGMYKRGRNFKIKDALIELGYEKCDNSQCWRWHHGQCKCTTE